MNDLPKISVGFFGTPDFSLQFLKNLFQKEVEIKFVVSQPATKSGRGKRIKLSAVEEWAIEKDIPTYTPKKTNEVDFLEMIKLIKVDFIIVVAYGNMVCDEIINHPKYQTINVHASLLPKWRGAAPIQRAIMNMDQETGISIMKIIPKLDAGPILMQSKIKITQEINHQELSDKMSKLGAKLILDTIKLIENNKVNFIEQNEAEVTYAKKIQKTETKINWNDSADKVIAKINAFYPNPGSWFELNGIRIKVIKAREIISKGLPGTILNDKFTIACSKNAIQIIELKKEGKQIMTTEDFLRGNEIKIGLTLN